MKLIFKKPTIETQKAMSQAALNPFTGRRINPEIKSAEESIKELTGHEHVKLVNSGNSAIISVMNALEGPFILPDQGGWSGLKKIAAFLKREVYFIPTEKGIIYPDLLEEYLKQLLVLPSALFITSFAGYTAEQPVKELFEVCCENDIILVEDASGSVGDPEKRLCNGDHAHIIIASTGSPKIVNVGNGGFISTNEKKILDNSRFLLKTLRADPITAAGIATEIKKASFNLFETMHACKILKKNIHHTFHEDKRGINVIVPSSDPKAHSRILREKINLDGRSMITTCPLYDRMMEKAVCIEIKNLDTDCLNRGNLSEIKEHVETTVFNTSNNEYSMHPKLKW
ncbi:MAG: DegT/DnrJ/EryC1/StrS family aminotransferase [Methanobacteriaceae archaeon]|nr:DegT/DnrJ/EryC1/StrS family aminotransferase [Methanobacteriaceae archaeon]MDP2836049.1 DegT/DnrJ/EryC1/StrS family aminotransferase [Methanobacteriaceae archaeon]MDP3485412.1 DegT/DnrJ/EryC1/StrS family aminotransferase [Methanobacteriaceae archaeon]MDP3623143.1 DegT/DnrJ/EryC1/StrS family aminotransferase [Methanobacteriaceae archaeon]